MNSRLFECRVLHARFAPKAHRFAYRIFLCGLDLDELPTLHRRLRLFSHNRANLYSLRENDFLPTLEAIFSGRAGPGQVHPPCPLGPPSSHTAARPATEANALGAVAPYPGLKQRLLAHLAARGTVLPADTRVLLVALPRVLGYLFNPVSFYFCFDGAGAPVAALAEVTNTFREVKPYVLGTETLRDGAFRLRVPKHFYVSPYSDVDVAFDFRLRVPGDRLAVQIDDYVGDQRTLTSSLIGPARPLTDARLAWYLLKYPFLTLQVITLIHWHALRLWLKKVPWFTKAARPADQRALYRPHHSIVPTTPS